MREIRIRKVPDKIYRVARSYASMVDLSVPEFALEALDEKIGRLSDAEEAAKLRTLQRRTDHANSRR